jgi:hypothetical protein
VQLVHRGDDPEEAVSTPIGQNGRMPPGESWRRAMELVAERRAAGARRRYRVYGRRVEQGWWAYEVGHVKEAPPAKVPEPPMSRALVATLARDMPRCAQRARSHHGGDFKVAWTSQHLATRVAVFLGHTVYQCQLPAPAIGRHWHTSTKKRRRAF